MMWNNTKHQEEQKKDDSLKAENKAIFNSENK